MVGSLRDRRFGLACAALLAVLLVAWLALGVSSPPSLAQDSPPATPGEQGQSPAETPAPTATTTSAATSTATVTSTATPTAPEASPVATGTAAETPTEMPVEGPTETPTAVPASPSEEPGPTDAGTPSLEVQVAPETGTPTPRPIEFPTPTPTPSLILLMDQVLTGLMGAAAWIWLTCGSLLFFIVAGIVAGLSFYRQGRNRYTLYELTPDEERNAEGNVEGKGRAQSSRQPPSGGADDSWPPSLP